MAEKLVRLRKNSIVIFEPTGIQGEVIKDEPKVGLTLVKWTNSNNTWVGRRFLKEPKIETMSLTIEKGVPIPTDAKPGRQRKRTYPFDQMKKGDSIWSDKVTNLRSALWQYNKRYPGQSFVAQSDVKDNVTGLRVWRVK